MADDIASVGIKIETGDIDRANVSLDTLAGKGASVDQSLGKIEGAAAKAGKSLDNLGRGAQSAAGIGDVGAKAQHAAQGIRAVGDNAEKAGHGVKSMAASMGGFGDVLSGIAMKAAAAAGAFVSLNKAFDAAAQWTDMSNRLKMVADGADGLARAQAEVVRIAQATRAPLEATAQLYQRIAQQQDALGMSTSRVAGVVETVSKAMALSGVSAGAANAALVQFGQALASGVLRGDELNSILEQAPGLAMALAEGLGTTTGKLREMGAQGQLTADMVVGALEKQANSINEQFDKMAPTVSQALTNVNTAFTQFVGKLDEATGLTAGLARTVDFLAKNFDTLAIVLGGSAIVGAVAAFGGLGAAIAAVGTAAAVLGGLLLTPIGLAVAAVAGLTAGYIAFKDELNGTGDAAITLGDIFGEVGRGIINAFGGAQAAVKQTGDASADAAENTIGYWEKGIRGVAALMDKLASVVNGTVLGIGQAIGNVASAMTDVFAKAFNWIAEKAEGLINKVSAGINATTKFIPFVPSLGQASFGRAAVSGVKLDVGGSFDRGMQMGQSSYWGDMAGGFIDGIRSQKASAAAQAASSEGVRAGKAADAKATRDLAEAEERLEQQRIKSLKIDKEYQQTLKDLVAMREAGRISEAEYVTKVEALATATYKASAAGQEAAKSAKDRKKASDEAAKEAEREAKAVKSFIDSLHAKIVAQEQELKGGEKLSQSDKLRLEYQEKLRTGALKMSVAEKARVEVMLKQHEVQEAGIKLQQEQAKAWEKASQDYDKYVRSIADEAEKLDDKNKATREEIDAMGLTARQLAELEKKRLSATIAAKQEQLSMTVLAGARDEEVQAILRQIAALEQRKALVGDKLQQQEMLDAQKEQLTMWQSIDKTAHDVFVNIFEDGAGTFKRLGQTLKAAVLDMLYQLTIKRWIINIGASMSANPAAFAQAMGGGSALGSGGGLLGNLSNAYSATNFLSGGALGGAIFGNSLAYSAMVPGLTSAAAGSQAAMLAAQTGQFGMAGATATAQAGGATMGGFSSLLTNPVTIGLGVVAALAMSGAFSRKHAQHNLEGTFGGATGFEGNWHDYYKGGLFRSSKTEDTPLDSGTLKALRDAWKAQEAAVTDYAKVLGLSTENIEGFTYRINLKLKDLGDPEAAGYMDKVWQMVNEAISTGSNEMAERILGTWTTTTREVEETIKTGFWDDETFTTVKKTVEETTYTASEYAREGERAIDTLTRLATSLQAANAAFDMLGLSLYEASLAGGDMASALVDKMGGKDAFTAQIGSYWQAYYSEAERAEYLNAQMARTLAAVGLELPTNIAGFRALVEAQDRNTDSGRAAFAALMSINGAFAELHPHAEAAAVAVDEVGNALSRVMVDLLAEHDRLQADLLQAQGDLDGSAAARRAIAIAGYTAEEMAAYDANQALRDQIAAIQQFSGIVGGIGNSLASLIQDGLLGNLSAADLGGRMADVVIGGVYNAMASGFSQQITGLLMNGLVTPMVQAALVGTSVSEAVSRAAIDKMMAQATAVAQALGAVLSDPAFRDAMAQVEGIMSGMAAAMAPAQAYYVNWDTSQQEAQRAAQEAQRLAQQAAQEAQRAADEEARRQQGIMNERMGLTKQLLQLEGNTVLLRQIELEALDPSNRALQQRIWAIEDETAAAEKYKSALKGAQDFLGGFTKNIEEFIFKVSHAQADAQQSYQMAAAKFTAQMTLARGGDRDAMNGITGYADTLIGSIRRESTTGDEANLRIARVLGQLASLPKQISAEQLIVDAIVNANTSLETVLSTNFASLDANVDGLLTASELAASGLATNTQISALMARVDANGDGMLSKQEIANSRLSALNTEQCTTNTNLGGITAAQQAANTWLGLIQTSDQTYSLANVNAINSSTSATVAAINKTNAQIGTFNRNYDNPVTAQFSADSPLYSIFKGIDETNTWLYKLHGLSTASVLYWIALLDDHRPVTVTSLNRTPADGTVFADGGYTGPGAKWEPAGVVHKGEVVWSQADVARWGGPGIVDALRQGAPGYASGGAVAISVPPLRLAGPAGDAEVRRLLSDVLTELRLQRSDDRDRHGSIAEPLQRMDRRGAKWDQDGLPEARTNEAIA